MNLKHKKILILSTGDVNGAYEAMYKIACILKSMNHDVVLCVKNKTKTDDFIIEYNNTKTVSRIRRIFFHTIQSILYKVKLKQVLLIDSKYGFFSKDEKSENINADHLIKKIGFIPEFIFTGMTIDFLNSTDLLNIYNKTGAEVYNITVDMNHFTGGCHFSWGCEGYIYGCSDTCPAILNEDQKLLAKQNFDIKYKNAQKANFKVIAGSGLTLEQAEMSKIYKNQDIIYNVNSLIDTELLSPRNRKVAKQIFNFEKISFIFYRVLKI
ncbi:hypothetical protein EVD20_14865 [Elizabethkingia bruuniana]|nr:hypothetical protein [Elizabethkingia bruuniana]QDZ63613.1 hypothetical protein EVD20_14865 [Elizabethkingia bruuniana]